MLSKRLAHILSQLMATETPLSSSVLSVSLQVTSRTIRTDIKELNERLAPYHAAVLAVKGAGYELLIKDENAFRRFMKEEVEQEEPLAVLPEERVLFILKKLLLAEQYVKLEDLQEHLFISKSTMSNDMKSVKRKLEPFELTLEAKPNKGYRIQGSEMKIRYCMSEYLFNERRSYQTIISTAVTILPKHELELIQKTVIDYINEERMNLSDICMNNLIVHVAIACKRIRHGNYVSVLPEEIKEIPRAKEYEVAKKMVERLEGLLDVLFPQEEIVYIAIHLLGTAKMVQSFSTSGQKQIVDDDTSRLVQKMLAAIDQKLQLDLADDAELMIGLSLHLKPAMNRCKYGMNLRNPMLDEIKAGFPIAFEAGIVASKIIEEQTGLPIHENEIGYMALHFGAALERRKMEIPPKRCLIVCASGAGSARLLQDRLRSQFGSKLTILGTAELYSLPHVSLHALDLMISTVPIQLELPIPVIQVNTILGGSDFQKIEEALTSETRVTLASQYIKKELVFTKRAFQTKEEVIIFLTKKVIDMGLAPVDLTQSVLEREQAAPTSFGHDTAIPHPMTPMTEETCWAICTLEKPIAWGDKKVQFVCLLCVEKENANDLKGMYRLLGELVHNVKLIHHLIACDTFEDMLDVMFKKLPSYKN
ncbi:BglG family transcription antiterminator [Bacillus sp. NPDC093026]|uniref:BglG family transcription antiterminator n=1 Tax=Bacillus sp. NPDC093026 TaxID=3363948 RepID=UPI00381DEFE6